MHTSFKHLKSFRKELVLGPFFKFLEAVFELFTPLVMAKLIDEGVPSSDSNLIFYYGFILVILTLLGFMFSMFCQYYAAKAQEGYGNQLREALFAHIQSLSLTQTESIGTNSLITRMTLDIQQMQYAVAMFIRLITRSPFIILGSLAMAYYINPTLALIFLGAIPFITLVLVFVMRKTLPLYKTIQANHDTLSTLTLESLTGSRVIRAFSNESVQFERFKDATGNLKNTSVKTGKIESLLNPSTFLIVNIATFFVLFLGSFQINQGHLSQGELIALVSYLTQILLSLYWIVNLVVICSKGYASALRVDAVFDIMPEIAPNNYLENPSDIKGSIAFDHVSFKYKTSKTETIKDLSFHVSQGETLGIIGGTGSGKTTLVSLLAGFYKVNQGAIYLDSVNINTIPNDILRKKIDVVFQKAVLFRGTIAENLYFGNTDANEEAMWHALELAEAKDFVRKHPQQLSAVVEQDGLNFSGGQRQRLTIARSLVGNPEIIVFDDTSSALDYQTDRQLRKNIESLDKTIITISQRISAIRDCHQILVLDKGEMVGYGTHQELMETCQVYQEISKSQHSTEGGIVS
ncbi:ABC transporter ATP-binding protein [Erysipelothrix rhusiopathiae]|uniref:ABC transporter ATP-binding protein n=1 Tax=Erysipelothrix rhusiopathiae TaxID=1648 RepID=UPI002B256039|nr:ABC transporter ATP-binding protein [Erysipelothrix rhusiopathiae]WRB92530.1 ABC transporter ATP-binding protein [Erysipelothrix rhusiopathiae]